MPERDVYGYGLSPGPGQRVQTRCPVRAVRCEVEPQSGDTLEDDFTIPARRVLVFHRWDPQDGVGNVAVLGEPNTRVEFRVPLGLAPCLPAHQFEAAP